MQWFPVSKSGRRVDAVPAEAQRLIEEDDDCALVTAARADPRAFIDLYERYFAKVLGYARLQLRDPEEAADATSLVFEKALRGLSGFRGRGSFAAWLFRIARNVVRDRQRRRDPEPLDPADIDRETNPQSGPEELLLDEERRAQLRALLAGLRPEQRHLLALRFGAGLSFDEISGITGDSPGALRVRVHRSLESLRRGLADER